MKAFEYAAPRSEAELVGLLASRWGETEILAGGTDLIGLMKKMVVTPRRVVNIKNIAAYRGIEADSQGVSIGAVSTLDDLLEHPALARYPALLQAIEGIASLQLQAQSTLGGELCRRPGCWYFRSGHGLLAGQGRLAADGDNRYHAILGNRGPAKFVAASRLAPALIALDARVRIAGPAAGDESIVPLESLYRIPGDEDQRETVLLPNQVVSHIRLPQPQGASAAYEVRHGSGPEAPLAAAAATLVVRGGVVVRARVVLGHVAPIPWVSAEAEQALVGRAIDRDAAGEAGEAAVAAAEPLSHNRYKVQLARVAVQRAVLKAAGLETGGF